MSADSTMDASKPVGFSSGVAGRPTAESMGEALLGSLLDRAHLIPPRLVGPLIAQEIQAIGGTEIAIYLQDYDQVHLQPLEGSGLVGERVLIDSSLAGRAFTTDTPVEEDLADGSVRMYLPMLDGSDRIGVLALRLPAVNDADRRLARRLAGLVADLVVTKSGYSDTFARFRTAQPMSLSAHLLRRTLPPLSMTNPDVELAGILEPAYQVGGDTFDYALNGHILHFGMFDAMGHGLEAATMASVVLAAYRHGRLSGMGLPQLHAAMDRTVAEVFPGRFVTAQIGELDTERGVMTWINAGHPSPLWIRDGRVIGELTGTIARPIGFGGASAHVMTAKLEPGDRVLIFTDGVVEERLEGGEQFGDARLRHLLERTTSQRLPVAEAVRRLSHALTAARYGRTSDDASLLMIEYKGPPRDDELAANLMATLRAGQHRSGHLNVQRTDEVG
ncbi:serine/threonine-protein phosphatase [Blastococcus sp. MG754426]|uniref:PP2C family protein-serine/threonine phosphatase n=1 Tax=unclassified Blastococcus TaxID=2619396 RepID=UPI001EEF87C3|nr:MULTISPECIES: SpoIIE family protein phosphatase [unclassified Blastococcus]MCF6507452.1 serine/threonine-protein phosphatase [Blastococcus sp. MG754426]MCF6512569.1 serine/threonine-protein phosphatase [Blastococcus sp. MG754427]